MADGISITPIGPFAASIRPPGSKSLTNRALLLAALAGGDSVLSGVLFSDDTRVMIAALRQLGVPLDVDERSESITVHGSPAFPKAGSSGTRLALDLGNSGTSIRFLAAMCATISGLEVRLDGIARMRQRPIGDLVDALRKIGAAVDYAGQPGYPPLDITGANLDGGEVVMRPTASSQFVSALLMAGANTKDGVKLVFDGPVVSKPYIQMTIGVMARFGHGAVKLDPLWHHVEVLGHEEATRQGQPHGYRAANYAIEPDASNASYFLAAAAIIPGSKCTIEGLGRWSLQGDVGFADVLHQMGAGLTFGPDFITVMGPPEGQQIRALRGINVDLNAMPDMAQTLAAVALFAQGPTTIRNIGNLRVKETDRLAALQTELTKLGATVEIDGDDLFIEPPADNRITPPPAGIDTYDDHRMAMSFAVVGLRTPAPGLVINNPRCVDKTFPRFFEYLAQFGKA